MKYLQVVAAPSPIESWLHTQLEARGVDRVYSRYILSLFQSTDVDQDFLDLDIPSKELKRLNKKSSHRISTHHSLASSARLQNRGLDPYKLIRASVIETLRSVSETKAGIETLVDELCDRLHSNEKLSGFHSNEKLSSFHSNSIDGAPLSTAQSLTNVSLGVVDLAQKYYDAFPALGSNHRQSSAALLLACCAARPSPWNGKNKSLAVPSVDKLPTSDSTTTLRTSANLEDKKNLSIIGDVEDKENFPTFVDLEDKENQIGNAALVKEATSAGVMDTLTPVDGAVTGNKMDRSLSVKRKLFVEVEETKDSVASLMEKVDGTKDLWGGDAPLSSSSTSSLLPAPPLSSLSSSSYPSVTSLTTGSGFIPCGTNLTTSIWSEVEWGGGSKWSGGGDDSGVCLASPPTPPPEEMMAPGKALSITTLHLKAVLNHCPETSAFKPVVPGLNPGGSNKPPGFTTGLLVLPPVAPSACEENLLTSASTHFCPIEKAPHYKTLAAEVVQYANGTTFSIASTMDEVDYHLAQDGTLTWDSGVYMEFKANGLNTECYNLCDPFKPKFRVQARGDKGVQTEAQGGAGHHEVACGNDIMEDFYFPGEESITRDIMRSLEESDSPLHASPSPLPPSSEPDLSDAEPPLSKKPCSPLSPLLLDAWAVAWPPFSIWSNTALTTRAGDGWPTPSHDYQELSKPGVVDTEEASPGGPLATAPATGLYTNYSIWAPPLPLDTNSNLILCTKCETPLPLGVNMGNLKISSDRKRRHSSSQYLGALSTFPCIKSEVSFFQQSITL